LAKNVCILEKLYPPNKWNRSNILRALNAHCCNSLFVTVDTNIAATDEGLAKVVRKLKDSEKLPNRNLQKGIPKLATIQMTGHRPWGYY
jgi:hypothetical protein